MRFSIFPTFAFLAAAVSAQEATVVVNNINTLTTKANALIAPAQQLTIVNAPQILIGTGPWPQVVLGLGDFVSTATTIVGSQGGTRTAYTGDAADEIAGAFGKLANELEQLLNILIGKAGFLTQIPFVGPPVSAVLRLVESAVDTFANLLLSAVQGDGPQQLLKNALAPLDGTVNKAITSYSPDGGSMS